MACTDSDYQEKRKPTGRYFFPGNSGDPHSFSEHSVFIRPF
jgi:hypothetical protein